MSLLTWWRRWRERRQRVELEDDIQDWPSEAGFFGR